MEYIVGRASFEEISKIEGLHPKGVVGNPIPYVECCRCINTIEVSDFGDMTAGCYDCREGYWKKFSNPGEQFLCDRCMWNEPKYIEIYGKR